MSSDFREILIPSIAFFVAFFLSFSLIEAVIILALNRLMFRYWGFTVNVLIRSKALYGSQIRVATLITITLLTGGLLFFTSFLQILASATMEIKVFAVEIFLAMILIYLTTTRKLTQLFIEKQIHLYLYLYVSVILYVFMVIQANQSYAQYKNFINANVVSVTGGVERILESDQKGRLLKTFRNQVAEGGCTEVDFVQGAETTGVRHFVYVITDPDLARAQKALPEDEVDPFVGRACTDGAETFLLTDYGKWYWVIDEA